MKQLLPLALIVLVAGPAGAASLARQCRHRCKDAIQACVATGGKRRRCRRDVLGRCRTDGIATCASTTGSTTTTTLPVGEVNACDVATATDLRNRAEVTVDFGGVGNAAAFAYDPPCFIVTPGTRVTFNGNFGFHPLVGGTVDDQRVKHPDAASPLAPTTTSGTSKSFVLSAAGTDPFYCNNHATIGMKGAAFVRP